MTLTELEEKILSLKTVSRLLRHLKLRGYPLTPVADRAGVSKTTIYNIAEGKPSSTNMLERVYTAVKEEYPEEWKIFMAEYADELMWLLRKITGEK